MDSAKNLLSVVALLKATDSGERIFLPGHVGTILVYRTFGWIYIENLLNSCRIGARFVKKEELSREILVQFFK